MPLIQTDLDGVLPVGPSRFDAVLCALVSEHLTNLPLTFAEFSRVLRPGGWLVFSAFRPQLAAAGIEANFESKGVEHRLGAEPHTVDDYLNRISESGFRIRSQQVFRGDSELIRKIGWAEKYRGRPLLLLIDATSNRRHPGRALTSEPNSKKGRQVPAPNANTDCPKPSTASPHPPWQPSSWRPNTP